MNLGEEERIQRLWSVYITVWMRMKIALMQGDASVYHTLTAPPPRHRPRHVNQASRDRYSERKKTAHEKRCSAVLPTVPFPLPTCLV